jgi:ADP-heptose:LPS heptosyltransferase
MRESSVDFESIGTRWDYIIDNSRLQSLDHMNIVPGFKKYYNESDNYFKTVKFHGITGSQPPIYIPNQQLRFNLAEESRKKAKSSYGSSPQKIAVLLAGSNERWLYPSLMSWEMILTALTNKYPGATICLIGKHSKDGRTTTSFTRLETDRLLSRDTRRISGFDLPLIEQMALIEASDVFIGPHSGFCFLAPTLGVPWLALSGGRWPEHFFNGIPFHSVMPDPKRFPWFTTYDDVSLIEQDSDGEGPRAVSMSRERFEVDLQETVEMTGRLMRNEISYEKAMSNHFPRLLEAAGNDVSKIWSFDGVHRQYL